MYFVKTATISTNCSNVMLRHHYIVAANIQNSSQVMIGLYYALAVSLESSLFTFLITVHFLSRKGRHPFFGLLFGCILLSYIFGGITEVVCQFLFLFGGSTSTLDVIYPIYDLVYSAITPLCFCCLIERTIATLWAVKYETIRTWPVFILPVFLAVSGYTLFASLQCRGCIVSAVLPITTIGGCVALYFINRKWTIRYQKDTSLMGTVPLSMRYQLIENMISVRKALLPVIIMDSLITLVDGFSFEVTTKIEEQEDSTCPSIWIYTPYILLNNMAMALEYSIPLYMLFGKSYRRHLPQTCSRFRGPTRVKQSSGSMIQNVFGKELNIVPTQNEYFAKLQKEWL